MARLIDADVLVEEMEKEIYRYWNEDGGGYYLAEDAIEEVKLAPTVEAEPVRRGHNENKEYHEADEFRCSECGLHLEDWTRYVCDEDSNEEYVQEYVFKRCPECGAMIVGE